MSKRKASQKKTAHRVIASTPAVRPLIGKLRRYWERWDDVKRGDHLRDLVSRGCSIRGLASDLGVPSTTLRRYMTLSSLDDADREALKAGESAKKALARKAVKDAATAGQERLKQEKKSGALSDEVADIILDFCRNSVPEAQIRDYDLPNLLRNVKEFIRGELGPCPPSIQLPKKISLTELYRITRPPESSDEIWLGHRAVWLAKIVMAKAPEFLIRETAIEKAERRAAELEVTPGEAEQISIQRRQFLRTGAFQPKQS